MIKNLDTKDLQVQFKGEERGERATGRQTRNQKMARGEGNDNIMPNDARVIINPRNRGESAHFSREQAQGLSPRQKGHKRLEHGG
jgi:hypothetical protein